MTKYNSFYNRNLPHYHPEGYTFFITFRLANSLPSNIVIQLKQEREKEVIKVSGYSNIKIRYEKYREIQSVYFGKFDNLLDSAYYGPLWLKEERVITGVKEVIHSLNMKLYKLFCYSIMPNHVHIVFTPNQNKELKIEFQIPHAGIKV